MESQAIQTVPDNQIQTQNQLSVRPPQLAPQDKERTSVSELACRPLSELEAGISLEIERIQTMSAENPLLALDTVIGFMLEIDMEILKNQAPMLIENAQQQATNFHATHKIGQTSREESTAIASMQKIQEAIAKLSAGRVKVRQAMGTGRQVYPQDTPNSIPASEPRALPESKGVVIDLPELRSPEPVVIKGEMPQDSL